MADWSDVMAATQAVVDPSTSAADLAAIASAQRGLWVQIANHPNAYPALLEWLSAQGDDAVRAAVASRQQSVVPPAPMMSQQPTVAPQYTMGTVAAPAMATAPASRKSMTKPLILGGAGVLLVIVAVVVALVIHSASSILRFDQLPTFVNILNAEDADIESPEDLGVDEWDMSDMPSGCQGVYQARNKILGEAEFDIPNVNFEDDSTVLLLTDHKTALSISDSLVQCQDDDVVKGFSQTTGGVSLSTWIVTGEEEEVRVAVYKNVVLFTYYDDDISTRGQWQSYMTTTFKSAVDKAIKG